MSLTLDPAKSMASNPLDSRAVMACYQECLALYQQPAPRTILCTIKEQRLSGRLATVPASTCTRQIVHPIAQKQCPQRDLAALLAFRQTPRATPDAMPLSQEQCLLVTLELA